MTASASKNKQTENALMAPMAGRVSESVLQLMQLFGIQRIECKKIRSADFERIVADIKTFEGTPQEIVACAMLVKDALSEILASVGVVSLDISSEAEEKTMLITTYESVVKAYNEYITGTVDSSDNTVDTPVKGKDPENGTTGTPDDKSTEVKKEEKSTNETKPEKDEVPVNENKDSACAEKCCKRSKK